MKKFIALGCLSLFTANLAYALPANLTETVQLESYECGTDTCYLNMRLYSIEGVSLSTFCQDKKYCNQYHKTATKGKDDFDPEDKYDIDRKARVTLKLVTNQFDGLKMYETTSITYLKD